MTTPVSGSLAATGEPIEVLVVDDNEEWARFVADDLERREESLSVSVTFGANEAMSALRERDSIDCVVADYVMPEVDGIQLLERVREEYPDLPFILVTGRGSEDVVLRALDAGVTDYLVKEPGADRTTRFVNKIRTAVEQCRLERAVAESEERYRTVTEQSRDAVVIVQDGRVAFCNRRLGEISGRAREELRELSFVELVHPDDRDDVRATIEAWLDDGAAGGLREARLRSTDGTIHHCEYTGRAITHEGAPAVLVSVRDVTERKLRERELRWERELNRTVQRALVEARTPGELEARIARQLTARGYDLVWFGEPDGGELTPRTVEGAVAYLEAFEPSIEAESNDSEPSVWAIRSGTPQFVDDFEELFPTAWREAALERGLHSGAALPLAYQGIAYGVLAVYGREPGRFDETERELLTELADTVAFALHTIETERTLAAERGVESTVQVDDAAYYLPAALREVTTGATDAELRVEGTIPREGATIQYLAIGGVDAAALRRALLAHPAVADVTRLAGGESRLQVTVTEPVPEADLASMGALVRSTSVTPRSATLRIELPDKGKLRSVVDRLDGSYGAASVRATVEGDHENATASTRIDMGALTEKQAAALEAAYRHGYFEQPRESSATEVAESLGITHSTYLQHLRAAQRKVFGSLYD